jgi:hypothetical protein
MKLWDVKTGKELPAFEIERSLENVRGLPNEQPAFSPDGRTAALPDRGLRGCSITLTPGRV